MCLLQGSCQDCCCRGLAEHDNTPSAFTQDKFRDLPQGADTIVFLALQVGGPKHGAGRAPLSQHVCMCFCVWPASELLNF